METGVARPEEINPQIKSMLFLSPSKMPIFYLKKKVNKWHCS